MTIGSKYGRMKKRTLENYCHNQIVTAKTARCSDGSNRQAGCPLYETKPDNLTESLAHSVDTAEQFRNFKELGLLPTLDKISAYEFICFDNAERAVRKINDEISKESTDKANKNSGNTEDSFKERKPRRTGGFA